MLLVVFALFALPQPAAHAQAVSGSVTVQSIINSYAGNGTVGYLGDNGPATSASFGYPTSVAVDGAGDLYIADTYNHVVREVAAGTGIITTVAGNGTPGYLGDTGPATSAELSNPTGVAVDAAGNIYIADSSNDVIRMVAATTGSMFGSTFATTAGDIYTVAGMGGTAGYTGDYNFATNAELNAPTGVAVDPAGDIYIADTANNVIRFVSHYSDTIWTVAGDNALGAGFSGDSGNATGARLSGPTGVALDGLGNLYILDTGNDVVRVVPVAGGTLFGTLTVQQAYIYTVAGMGGQSGYSGDGGLAMLAELNSPEAVAVDNAGDLYIADTKNSVIRNVNASSGNITTVAGDGAPAIAAMEA